MAASSAARLASTSDLEVEISPRVIESLNIKPSHGPEVETSKPLWDYQIVGLAWMHRLWSLGLGGILGDEMGVGKTLQLLTLACALSNEDPDKPVLIIVPGNLLLKWCKDFVDFTPSFVREVHVHRGPARSKDPRFLSRQSIILTTYSMLVEDAKIFELLDFSGVLCDEAHELREPLTHRHIAVKALNAKAKFLATGTPIQNRLTDYWALMDIVAPGILGPRQEFHALVQDSPADARYLADLTAHRVLRRTQVQVDIDVPAGAVVRVPLELSASQRRSYTEIDTQGTGTALGMELFSTLRRFTAHPGDFLGSDNAQYNAKTEYLLDSLEQVFAQNEKAVVFLADFNKPRDLYRSAIVANFPRVWAGTLDGRTPVEHRHVLLEEFTNVVGPAVLLVNPTVGGQGLSMVAANHVYHLNPAWNPAKTDQATFRVTRPGQLKETTSHHLYFDDTIESRIESLVEGKRQISLAALTRLENETARHEASVSEIFRLGGENDFRL